MTPRDGTCAVLVFPLNETTSKSRNENGGLQRDGLKDEDDTDEESDDKEEGSEAYTGNF